MATILIAEKLFNQLDVDLFLLEYDSDRAGTFEALRFVPRNKAVVLGLVSSKLPELESQEQLTRRIEEASRYIPLEHLAAQPAVRLRLGDGRQPADRRRSVAQAAARGRHGAPGMEGRMTTGQTIQVTGAAWKCLEGAYDVQIHVGPDVIPRRIDDIDCAKEFLAHGLKGFVLKSHYVPDGRARAGRPKGRAGFRRRAARSRSTTASADFNPVAVELAGRSDCKIVWMPTVDAENETAGRLDGGSDKLPFWAKIQRELAAEGHLASPAERPRRSRESRRAGPPLPGAHRQAQHDPGDRPPRAAGDLRAGARGAGDRREEGARHPRRVSRRRA